MKKIIAVLLSMLCVNLSFSKALINGIEVPVQYEIVEVKPLFPGGMSEFMQFVMKNFQIQEDEEGNIPTGTVHVSIIISSDGTVSQVNILRDVGNAGKEIKRILAKCPRWTPGRMKGQNVSVEYNFPITIK
jgi:hypothetical protein